MKFLSQVSNPFLPINLLFCKVLEILKVREQVFPGTEVFGDVSLDPENLVFFIHVTMFRKSFC